MSTAENSSLWRPDTQAVRGGLARSEYQEMSEALFLTSGFVYDTAADAEAAFSGEVDRFVYSRYGNPTVEVFQDRLRLIEGAEACFATASGMSAVFVALAALLKAGDRVVAARSLFGSCFVILNE
ncbi:MAG: PLP-dependent transferase, partial [Mycobacteriaceae bacterium]